MNLARLLILNRLPATPTGGWIHIVPKGELPNPAADVVQVLDERAHNSILANIETDKQRLGNKWPGIYAGREHFIYNEDADSAALAWFKEFQKRDDGIWAKDDGLTPTGRQAITNGEYKFTSFAADPRDTEKLDGNRVRILKIDTVGFTNQANGKELLTPITNRGEDRSQRGAARPRALRGEAFQAIANRVQNELGTDFTTAWNLSREIFPHVYNTAFDIDDPVLPRTSRQSRAADEKQGLAIARASAIANRYSFQTCFQTGSRQTPMLLNRDARPDCIAPSDWDLALRCEADVLEAIETSMETTLDRGLSLLFRGDWSQNIARVFVTSIEGLVQANGWTVQEASDFLKSTEPVLWAAGIWFNRDSQ